MKIKVITKQQQETINFAKSLAKSILTPTVISLVGDLGAGKTTFTKGLAEGLGVAGNVTSPTFTILNEYQGTKFKLFHFDMYRLASKDEALELGFEEYFDLKTLKDVCVVEWAENVEGLLPIKRIEITFKKINDNSREITVDYKGII